MAGATSVYGLPYQALTDPPHGPNLGQNLAEAVEAELARIDGDVAGVQALGIVGGKVYNASTTSIAVGLGAGTETVIMDSGLRSYKAGQRYNIGANVHWNGSAGGQNVEMKIREDSISGAERAYHVAKGQSAGTPYQDDFIAAFEPGADVSKVFVVTVKLLTTSTTINISRTGSGNANSAARVEVVCVGAAGRMTSA